LRGLLASNAQQTPRASNKRGCTSPWPGDAPPDSSAARLQTLSALVVLIVRNAKSDMKMENPDTLALSPGAHVGPYEVVARIGVGGMGEVYRAIHTTLKRAVAIKVLPASVAGDAQRLARFEREAEVLASLNHPNIAAIYGVQPWPRGIALVMELVEGDNLRACFQRSWPMPGALDIARQVLAALGAAHRTGVVHRDLKPENVMVRPDGYVKVLDFGLAKWEPSSLRADAARTTLNISAPGQLLGTVDYMSPEQIQGRPVDARSDLFAFGIVLHEMLTGRHHWPRSSAVDTLHAIMHDEPPSIESPPVGAGIGAVVQRLLCKRAPERYASAEAVIDALAIAADSHPATASRASPHLLTSIAVLPFVVLNDIGDGRAMSLGFADAIIAIISNLEDVVVAPTSAILNYPAGVEPARVARELRVRYTLQGTVQTVDRHWRVSIQLFDAAMQKMMSSDRFSMQGDLWTQSEQCSVELT
jgi:serine/threonine protein kinase